MERKAERVEQRCKGTVGKEVLRVEVMRREERYQWRASAYKQKLREGVDVVATVDRRVGPDLGELQCSRDVGLARRDGKMPTLFVGWLFE